VKGSSDERWQRLLRGDDLPQFAHRKLALRDISTVPPSAAKNLKRPTQHITTLVVPGYIDGSFPESRAIQKLTAFSRFGPTNALASTKGAVPGWSASRK
jgi:hypothetical protein